MCIVENVYWETIKLFEIEIEIYISYSWGMGQLTSIVCLKISIINKY